MNTSAYLKRIRYQGSLRPTHDTLRSLHVAHLLTVPFENLDIHLGRPITLDGAGLFSKIVGSRRGGFCYELNALFAVLLGSLGYEVAMMSAGVAHEKGGFGPEFDHMALMVLLKKRWLADVGFGDSFREPLLLDETAQSLQNGVAYRVDHDSGYWILLRREFNRWKPQYRFR